MSLACSLRFRKTWVDPSSMPELKYAFTPLQWIHDSPKLNDSRNFMKTNFPNMTPPELCWGRDNSGNDLQTEKGGL